MNSWVLTILILAIILWCVARTGPRRAQRAHRQLARNCGGRFVAGWFLEQNLVVIPYGDAEIQVRLRCTSWLAGRYAAEFRACWVGGRPDIAPTELPHVAIPGNRQPGGSVQLREAATQLLTSTAVEHVWVRSARGKFLSQAVLTSPEIGPVQEWFDKTLRLYGLLVAETEAGIEFSAARRLAAAEALCQVCGVPPAEAETVYCERCGAPHHAECWNYNHGCAIYGCK